MIILPMIMRCKSLIFVLIICIGNNYGASARAPGEISKSKCTEYSKFVKSLPDACEHRIVKRVVGGVTAGRREFPHMAALGYEKSSGEISWLCGGILISEHFILTSAVCLQPPAIYNAPKYVKLGVNNLNDTGAHLQQRNIAAVILHPEFGKLKMYHDIGLVKLEKPAEINAFVRPACLNSDREIRDKTAIATGWGKTLTARQSNELMKVTLDLIDHDLCAKAYNFTGLENGIVDDVHICAGSLTNDGKDTCQGDTGGPLQVYHAGDDIDCMYDIIGLTSFGQNCGHAPGVYTRVSNYIKWVEDTVWPETSKH